MQGILRDISSIVPSQTGKEKVMLLLVTFAKATILHVENPDVSIKDPARTTK